MAVDWTKSMQQTFEYYTVNPSTWQDDKQIKTITSSSIEWDEESDTLGSATIDITENIGEQYVRIYLVTIQNGVTERHVLGTFLLQTSPGSFDGKVKTISVDGYSPLIELNEKNLPIGYYIPKETKIMDEVYKTKIMDEAYRIARDNMRAPVVKTENEETLEEHFVADPDKKCLGFLRDLVNNAKFTIGLDEIGRVVFKPKQKLAALQPVFTFTDDNSSILQPDIEMEEDIFGIPNEVTVVCSSSDGKKNFEVVVRNDDVASPTSTVQRGRIIPYREINPESLADPTDARVKEYAEQLLEALSTVEQTLSYTHGYCGNRIGDCVRLNYRSAGLNNVKAKVISQSIDCTPGCQVSETAVYTKKYWTKTNTTVKESTNGTN